MDEHDTYINRTLRVILRSLLKPNDGYVELSKALKRMSEQRISTFEFLRRSEIVSNCFVLCMLLSEMLTLRLNLKRKKIFVPPWPGSAC